MSYHPKVNDYVEWKNGIEGWIYFKDSSYVTIEAKVCPKDFINLRHSPIHTNNRLLILCFPDQWKELKYIRSRQSIYEE